MNSCQVKKTFLGSLLKKGLNQEELTLKLIFKDKLPSIII